MKRKKPKSPWAMQVGTAAECLTTTAEERLAGIPADVKAEIEARYSAPFKRKEEP